ncbi:MAG: hypothetical protein M0Q51_00555 [Bacteroidales bacterium]|nr:hypothetical protein [Bacteroidales bacterium]
MKQILMIIAMIIAIAAITYSCKDENRQDELNGSLNDTESNLIKAFQEAKSNDDLVINHYDPDGQYLSPLIFLEDSLYHMNDSLCNIYYLTYCQEMMEGDSMMNGNMMDSNMMGGGMMGGDMMGDDTLHGSGMMAMHSFMGDTARVNQTYRELIAIRQAHPSHHPVKQ